MPGPHPDDDLLRRFLAGEHRACAEVERWAREIVGFRPYGIPRDEWDDVVQQTVTMVWRACSRDGFQLRRSLKGFVHTVVMARCVDWLRRRRRVEEVDESFADPGPTPSERHARDRRWQAVLDVIERLSDTCRELIRMHFFDELPYAQIAARVGRAEATLRVRMFQCMKEVRRQLAREVE